MDSLITRYRPTKWADVIGQNEIVKSLKEILEGNTSHAFLFVGNSGVGKTTIARLIAQELGAVHPGDITEYDAGQLTGIDDIRQLVAGLKYKPIGKSQVKCVIINEGHRLTVAAQDALLTALEEPASHTYFFLTTTEGNRIRPAIRTRCTSYELKPVSNNTLFDFLAKIADAEHFQISDEVLDLCVKEANGSPRQALANLTVCSNTVERAEAVTLLRTADGEDRETIELCRMLLRGGDWNQIAPILKGMNEQNPESIRQTVRAYMTKVILESTKEPERVHALNILEVFSQPFNYYDGLSPVVLAVGKLLYS